MVVGLSWPPETFLARLFRGLIQAGMEISVATPTEPEGEWRAEPHFSWVPVPEWEGSGWPRLWRSGRQLSQRVVTARPELHAVYTASASFTGLERIRQIQQWAPFAGEKWDVLYCPWNSGAIAYLNLFSRAPTVISCRGAQINIAPKNPERQALREGLRRTFEQAAAVHCVSAAIREEARAFGLDPAKAIIIHPAVDPEFFKPGDEPISMPDRYRLITTGSLIWRKGYEYLLAAVRELVDRGVPVHLTIIGDGPERQRLLFTIHDLGLQEVVEAPGRLTSDQVRRRLRAADVFVLSSLSEGISNAVLEGMACGLPVVTTAVGGMLEAVDDGVEGYVVPARDVDALAYALEKLWREPGRRGPMGQAGRARIERDFSLSDQIEAFVRLFKSVA